MDVDSRPCSSTGRQPGRWTRQECYEVARQKRIPIWNHETGRMRRMDDICADLAAAQMGSKRGHAPTRAPFDWGLSSYVSDVQAALALYRSERALVADLAERLRLNPLL